MPQKRCRCLAQIIAKASYTSIGYFFFYQRPKRGTQSERTLEYILPAVLSPSHVRLVLVAHAEAF
jgi:hypothetical protein